MPNIDIQQQQHMNMVESSSMVRRDVPVGVPLDLSTPTGMSSIGTCGENCKSDNVPKYRGN